ncbi:hypothetical protein CR513_23869, partial [Mucuna pruriens]
MEDFNRIIPPHDVLQSDRFILALTPDVNFSTKTAYRLLKRDDSVRTHGIWRKIWDKGIHIRVCFLWKVMHNNILTIVFRQSRGLCNNALCIICHMEDETIIHVLRDSVNVKLNLNEILIAQSDIKWRKLFTIVANGGFPLSNYIKTYLAENTTKCLTFCRCGSSNEEDFTSSAYYMGCSS